MTKLEKIAIAALSAMLLVSAFIIYQRSNPNSVDIGEPTETTQKETEGAN